MLGRTVIGQPEASPFVQTTSAETIEVALDAALPYELDGDARAETRAAALSRGARRHRRLRARDRGGSMSTAALVPETWGLDG